MTLAAEPRTPRVWLIPPGDALKVRRFYGVLFDDHERLQMEETLREMSARLSRATQVATVGEISASIAHEINQPLAALVTKRAA